ncbi:MAG: hypothetical protein KGI60_02040 [Patescibacteria group bacterium]|nr:hypothetical protein [Patescibacteria group bacterium]
MGKPSSSVNFDELCRRLITDRMFFENLPSGILTCPETQILDFLENDSYLLYKRIYCFGSQAQMRIISDAYGARSRVFTAVRRIKDSPLALEIHFVSSECLPSNGWFPVKHYQLIIGVFTLSDILDSLDEYVKLPSLIHRAKPRKIFEIHYRTVIRPPWLRRWVETLACSTAQRTRQTILHELERMEAALQWHSYNRRSLGPLLWLNDKD